MTPILEKLNYFKSFKPIRALSKLIAIALLITNISSAKASGFPPTPFTNIDSPHIDYSCYYVKPEPITMNDWGHGGGIECRFILEAALSDITIYSYKSYLGSPNTPQGYDTLVLPGNLPAGTVIGDAQYLSNPTGGRNGFLASFMVAGTGPNGEEVIKSIANMPVGYANIVYLPLARR
jgi:hypothetical protein